MTPEERTRAGAAVSTRMAELQVTAARVQRDAPVDAKTLGSLLHGERWPNAATRGRLEVALRWPAGEIERRARNEHPAPVMLRPAAHLSDAELIAELAYRLGQRPARS